MIVRTLEEIIGSENDIAPETGTWASRRMLLKKDGMGFSFHDTTIFAGTTTLIWYKNHVDEKDSILIFIKGNKESIRLY